MEPINPEWYGELKGEPLRERNFTASLAARIKERIALPADRGSSYRRVASAGLIVTIIASMAIFFDGISRSQTHILLNKPATDAVGPAIGAQGAVKVRFGPPILSDGRTKSTADENAARHKLTTIEPADKAKIELWTVRFERGYYKLGADYYVKEGSAPEWQRQSTATFVKTENESGLSKLDFSSGTFGFDPNFTVLAGMLMEDTISAVYLTDGGGARTDASITRNADGRFWVAIVSGSPAEYAFHALDRDGRPIADAGQ